MNCCWLILLLLFCGGNGNGLFGQNGNGCGCEEPVRPKPPAGDLNLPAADRNRNPALARIPVLNPASSRDPSVGTALPAAARMKVTESRICKSLEGIA